MSRANWAHVAYRTSSDGFLGESGQIVVQRNDRPPHRSGNQHLIDCYDQAAELLKKHNRFSIKFAEALLLNETMDAEEVGSCVPQLPERTGA